MCCLGEYSTETAIYSHAFDAHGNTKLHVLFLMDARSNCHHQTWVAIWKDHGFGTHASHAKVKMFNVCFFFKHHHSDMLIGFANLCEVVSC